MIITNILRIRVVVVLSSVVMLALTATPANAAKKHKKQQQNVHKQNGGAPAASAGQFTVARSVKNRAGHAVAGALVRLQHLAAHKNRASGGSRHVRTNKAGDFTIHAPVGRYALFASKPSVGSVRAFVTPSPGSTTRVTLIIAPHHHRHHHHRPHHRRLVTPKRVPAPPGQPAPM